ncbi:MAG: hypothetical protein K2W92_01880 [Alphaproteobacteria bacterium]|nr:hypothetical protein [Alphaproteobacteria bacterium]
MLLSVRSLQETLQQNEEDLLEDFTSKITDHLQMKIEESRKTLGSVVDSEQLLLFYLKNKKKL